MSAFALLDPASSYPLPKTFSYADYIEAEQELWAIFPETDGKRVNFVQVGLTAQVYTEVFDDGSELEPNETYLVMPCPDLTMRPIRMEVCRRLTLSEYRMGHLTAVKLMGMVPEVGDIMREIGVQILGPEVIDEVESRFRDNQ